MHNKIHSSFNRMKSVSHHVKKNLKSVQDIVHSQDCVVVAFYLEKLYNKTIVAY